MHITALFIVTLSIGITHVLSAPVYADYWLVKRAGNPVNPIPILPSTPQGSNVASSQPFIKVPAGNSAARFDKLKLSTTQFPANHKAIATSSRGSCLGPEIDKTSSTICHSGPRNPGRTRNDVYLFPDGKGGPDTDSALKKVTIGDQIGSGTFGSVHEVDNHELDHHGPLVAKQFYDSYSIHTAKEINNLRQVGQLHASGIYKGRAYAVMPKVKGVHLTQTSSYSKASLSGDEALDTLMKNAKGKASEAVLENAKEHGLVHEDAHLGNVRYEEDDKGNLSKAHLIDWGIARQAPKGKGPNGKFTKEQESQIDLMTMSDFVREY